MAEDKKETTAPSKDSLLKHLALVAAQSVENQAGKIGCNPFIWVRDNVTPLEDALKKVTGNVPADLASKVLALKALPVPPAVKPVSPA